MPPPPKMSSIHYPYSMLSSFDSCSCLVFPISYIEEALFSSLYVLASSVIDQLTMKVWVHFWALYSVPSIYMSIFVPI